MARAEARFVCQQCGAAHPKWAGRCDACGGWNCLVEEVARESAPKGLGRAKGRKLAFVGLEGAAQAMPRRNSGIAEFDRVCGGGMVPGSALLVGGDPGIGKSTVLLQVTAALASGRAGKQLDCAYISGEESLDQVRLRAQRLGVAGAPVQLAAATSIRDIAASLEDGSTPDVVVVDSIQTMYLDTLDSAPGTVSQVRAAAQELIRLAKQRGFCVILVGHVTKEGLIAGPRVLEHMVDTVLYFEGERGHQFRILRAVKNRFGPTDEIGVFEMTDAGLSEVPNPSALFLAERQGDVSGAAVFAGMEGTRPLLVEIQALVAPSSLGTPRRAVVGWDGSRLAMVLAVLEARCGIEIGARDIYLNVAGGLRIAEPAADLAVAAALVSALTLDPVPAETVIFGEIGLSGEVRPVGQAEARLKEAGKLGFTQAFLPPQRGRGKERPAAGGVALREIRHLRQLVESFETTPQRAAQHRDAGSAPMNGLDIVVLAVILLSALFGFTRGLVKEALSIAAWIGAGFAAAYGFAYVIPARLLPKGPVAAFIAVGVLFLVTLVILSFLASMMSARVRQSTLSTLDRTLGLVFGLVRGVLLACLGYIALDWAMPAGGDRPAWIEEARTRYLLENGADRLRALVPRAYRDKAVTAISDSKFTAEQIKEATGAIRALSTPRGPAASGRESGSTYSPDDRHELDRLIQQRQDER